MGTSQHEWAYCVVHEHRSSGVDFIENKIVSKSKLKNQGDC